MTDNRIDPISPLVSDIGGQHPWGSFIRRTRNPAVCGRYSSGRYGCPHAFPFVHTLQHARAGPESGGWLPPPAAIAVDVALIEAASAVAQA